jgi:hypothetical protein
MLVSRKLDETFNILRYSGAPLNFEVCPFTLKLYPSDEFRSLYSTNNAVIYSIGAVFIFAFVTLVFIMYDANVERRQKVVLNTAEKTEAIVSSLFPSAIRDQMLQLEKQPTKSMSPYMSLPRIAEESTNAMATLYAETTIFFADLAGFTAWSR